LPIDCDDLSGTAGVVEEYDTGASELRNLGNGAYRFNWATSKGFADTCRRLRLDLGEQNPDGTPFYRTRRFPLHQVGGHLAQCPESRLQR